MAQTLDALIIELRADIRGLQVALTDAQGRVRRFSSESSREISTLQSAINGVRNAVIAMGGVWAAFRIGQGIVDAGMQMQALQNRMLAATGSAEVAADAFAYVRSEAERLGLDVRATADGFAGFSASALRAGLTLQQTKEIFTGVSEAATSLHLSNERVGLVFKALEQIAAKGTVQMEELKGQLGESLPGAFEIAAKAMGVTTQELGDLMSEGKVMAADFLPRFAATVRQELAGSLDEASNSAQAAFNRMNNAFYDLQTSLASAGLLDAVTAAVKEITAALNDPQLQSGLASLVSGLGEAIGYAVRLAAALGGLSQKITAMADSGMETVFGKDVGDAIRRQRASNASDETFSERMLQQYIDDFRAKNPAATVPGSYTLGRASSGVSSGNSKAAEKAAKARSQLLDQVNSIHYANSDDVEQENIRYEEQLKKLQEALEASAITKEKFRELEAEAEQAHQDRLTDIRGEALQKELANQQKASDLKRNMEEKTLNSIHNLVQLFAGKNKAVALALLAFDKARAIAQAMIETHVAAAAALKYDPTGATSARVTALGYANVAAIAATGIAEAAMMAKSSSSDSSYSTTSSGTLATSDTGAGSASPAVARQVYINLGNDDGMFSKTQVRALIEQLNEALKDGSRLDVVMAR